MPCEFSKVEACEVFHDRENRVYFFDDVLHRIKRKYILAELADEAGNFREFYRIQRKYILAELADEAGRREGLFYILRSLVCFNINLSTFPQYYQLFVANILYC